MSTTTPNSPKTSDLRQGGIWLGIDPGSRVTGYALLEDLGQRVRVLEYGVFRAKEGDPLESRILQIATPLKQRIEQYRPDHLVMESAFVQKNVRSALVLGHVRGAVMLLAAQEGIPFSELSPASVKQAVTGKGSADKQTVAWMMQRHLQLVELPSPADASDALAIAWAGLTASRNPLAGR